MRHLEVNAAMKSWGLRHGWTLPSDLAALEICREALSGVGVMFESVQGSEAHCAIKMHGVELLDAVRSATIELHDLSLVSGASQWALRLPPFIQHYMQRDARWFGIPMGIHQANLIWVNLAIEQRFGPAPTKNVPEFIDWMRRLQNQLPYPLAMGAEPWQVGVAFEAIVLAVAGAEIYRWAFDALHPGTWTHPLMVQSLTLMASLRELVDPSAEHLRWDAQLQRVHDGQCAVQFMGDWVRAQGLHDIHGVTAPGTTGHFVAINDFFVPLVHADASLQELVGGTFTTRTFQSRYALQKGCMPGVTDAWDDVDATRAAMLRQPSCVLPSFVFDQCGELGVKNALLNVLADWFLAGGQAVDQAQTMSQLCRLFRESKGLP